MLSSVGVQRNSRVSSVSRTTNKRMRITRTLKQDQNESKGNSTMNTTQYPKKHRDSTRESALHPKPTRPVAGGGASRTSDGRLDVKLSVPGGPGNGTNPEQC